MIIAAVAVDTRGCVEPLANLGEEMVKRGHKFRILITTPFSTSTKLGVAALPLYSGSAFL